MQLTKKELAGRWNCSTRTVERDVKRFGLVPAGFIGHQPVFATEAIERMEKRRHSHKLKTLGYSAILTVAQAKAIARRNGGKPVTKPVRGAKKGVAL